MPFCVFCALDIDHPSSEVFKCPLLDLIETIDVQVANMQSPAVVHLARSAVNGGGWLLARCDGDD